MSVTNEKENHHGYAKKRIIACPDAFFKIHRSSREEDDIDDIEIGANTDISVHDEGNISESSGDFDISSLLSK